MAFTLWILVSATTHSKGSDGRTAVLRGDVLHFEDSNDWRTLKAEWIRDAVRKHCRVDINNAVIEGDLDLQYAQCEKEISLVDCKFTGTVNFSYAVFKQKLNLSGSDFDKKANFAYATFEYDVSLDDTVFRKPNAENGDNTGPTAVVFTNSHIKGTFSMQQARLRDGVDIIFNGAAIDKGTFLRESEFGGDVDFQAAILGISGDFQGTIYDKRATFAGATIGGQMLFQGAVFYGDADFGLAHIIGPAFFSTSDNETHQWPAVFHMAAIFTNARFDDIATFQDVWFRGVALFDGIRVKGTLDFSHDPKKHHRKLRFEKNASFQGIEVGKLVKFDDAEFGGIANFNSAHVGESSSFDRANFGGVASFIESRHDGTLAFESTVFQKGVDLSGAVVGADFVLSHAACKGPAKFHSAKIDGEAKLSAASFEQGVYFDQTHFGRSLTFNNVTCHGEANLAAITVEGRTDFTSTTFNGTLELSEGALHQILFSNVVCRQRANFALTHFKGSADFHHSYFMGELLFQKCTIDGDLLFFLAHFGAKSDFTLSTISGSATFTGARFDDNIVFAAVSGSLGANFTGAKFLKLASFDGAHFSSMTLFDSTEFFGKASFREASLTSIHFLPEAVNEQKVASPGQAIQSQAIPRHPTQFRGALDLRGCTYERISTDESKMLDHLSWIDETTGHPLPYDRGPYVQLEKVFAAAGEEERADSVYLARQKAECDHMWEQHQYGSWLFSKLYGFVANYGVRPYRLLVVSVLLLFLGTVFFRNATTVMPAEKEAIQAAVPSPSWTAWDAFRLTVRYFLPVTIAMGSRWKASEEPVPLKLRVSPLRWNWRAQPSTVATILQIAGWILVPLGVAALTGLLRIKA